MDETRLEFYRDNRKAWRWRYRATNGRILADGGQGYTRRIDAVRSAEIVTGLSDETPETFGTIPGEPPEET